MNNQIQNAYINALLADAAYVDIDKFSDKLADRLTQSQANFLLTNFEVASFVNKDDTPLIGSGFDATVWRGKANTPYAGQVYVSMRGTQPGDGGADIAADLDLAFNAGARSQLIDMVNWWLRATTASGQSARQIKWDALRTPDPNNPLTIKPGFVDDTAVIGTGELNLVSHVQVNGHSLGGHLAAAFSRIFGGSLNIDGIATFNSAGFNGASTEAMFTQLGVLLGKALPRFPTEKQTNYFADNGTTVTTNTWWFNQMGARQGLYQEDTLGINPIANHSMYKQTDLLALGAVMEALDSSMTFNKLNSIIKAGSNDMKASYEGVLDGLRKIILGSSYKTSTAIGDVSGNADSRISYHQNLKALTDSAAYQALLPTGYDALKLAPNGTPKITLSAVAGDANLVAKAKTNFSDLLALQTLSPVVIEAASGTTQASIDTILGENNKDLYADWQADKALIAQGKAPKTFTDVYLHSRQSMLQTLQVRNIDDIEGIVNLGKDERVTIIDSDGGLNASLNKACKPHAFTKSSLQGLRASTLAKNDSNWRVTA